MSWYKFKCRCPVSGCEDSSPKEWTHSNCGGGLFINNNAYLGCGECQTIFPFLSWRFSCQGHGGYYGSPSQMSILYLSAVAGDICESVGDFAWAVQFALSIKNML